MKGEKQLQKQNFLLHLQQNTLIKQQTELVTGSSKPPCGSAVIQRCPTDPTRTYTFCSEALADLSYVPRGWLQTLDLNMVTWKSLLEARWIGQWLWKTFFYSDMYRVSTNTLGNLAIELELQYCGRQGPIYPATLRNGKKCCLGLPLHAQWL